MRTNTLRKRLAAFLLSVVLLCSNAQVMAISGENNIDDFDETVFSIEEESPAESVSSPQTYFANVKAKGGFTDEEAERFCDLYPNSVDGFDALVDYLEMTEVLENSDLRSLCFPGNNAVVSHDEGLTSGNILPKCKDMFLSGMTAEDIKTAVVKESCDYISANIASTAVNGNLGVDINTDTAECKSLEQVVSAEMLSDSSDEEEDDITPPFYITNNSGESISMIKGTLEYTYGIASVSGRNGMNLTLGIKYDVTKTFLDSYKEILNGVSGSDVYVVMKKRTGKPDLPPNQIAVGWIFDLPCLKTENKKEYIYLPGSGEYQMSRCLNLSKKRYEDADINGVSKVTQVTFVDGRVYSFDTEKMHLLRQTDRFGNQIDYHYNSDGRLYEISDNGSKSIAIAYSTFAGGDYIATITPCEGNAERIYFKRHTIAGSGEIEDLDYYTIEYAEKVVSSDEALRTTFTYFEAGNGKDSYDNLYNPKIFMKSVGFHTGVESVYTYQFEGNDKVWNNIIRREDKIGDISYNVKTATGLTWTGDCVKTTYSSSTSTSGKTMHMKKDVYNTDADSDGEVYSKEDTTYETTYWKPKSTTTYYYSKLANGDAAKMPSSDLRTYDEYGNMKMYQNVKGNSINYKYDECTLDAEDAHYGLLLETVFSYDGNTIVSTNTLTADGKNIASTVTTVKNNSTKVVKTAAKKVYEYDAYGNVTSVKQYVSDDEYVTTLMSYIESGAEADTGGYNVFSKTVKGSGYPQGVTDTYTYGENGLLASSTDANNASTSFEYDALGRLSLTRLPNNTVTTVSRDDVNNDVTYTTVDGATIKKDFDALGNLVKTILVSESEDTANTVLSEKTYNSRGLLTHEKAYTGTDNFYTVDYTYDSLNRLTQKSLKDSDGNEQNKTVTEYGFAKLYMGQTVEDTSRYTIYCKTVTVTVYNNAGNVASKKRTYTNCYGEVVMDCLVDGTSEVGKIYYQYDDENRLICKYYETAPKVTHALVRYNYDHLGNVISEIKADGSSRTYSYDFAGRLLSETDFTGNKTQYTYDCLGNNRTKKLPSGNISTMEYDAVGNVTKVTIPTGFDGENADSVTEYTYDSVGNRTDTKSIIDSDSAVYAHYVYNGAGRITEMYTGLSAPYSSDMSEDEYSKYTYSYNKNGQATSETNALGAVSSYTYSPYGFLMSSTDPNGTVATYTYDDCGNVITEALHNNSGGNTSTSYTYDGVNLITADGGGETVTSNYDNLGRLASEVYGFVTVHYTYDDYGNRLTQDVVSTQRKSLTTYEYDADFNLTSVTTDEGHRVEYEYDSDGRKTLDKFYKLCYNGSGDESYEQIAESQTSYNANGAVLSKTNSIGDTAVNSISLEYYAGGNIKSETDSVTSSTKSYTYDLLGQLLTETQYKGTNEKPRIFSAYKYDAAGNRILKTEYTNPGDDRLEETSITSSIYDKENRLITEFKNDGTSTDYTYDANGNTLTAGDKTYTYDRKNRQISYTSGDTNASYTYYPNGMRCSKYVNGKTATYYWNSDGSMVFETCGNNEKDYYFGGSLFVTDGLFCFTNAHGDVIALFDDDGTITKRYEYDAFGNELTPDESDRNPYRYCAEYFDIESGTIYLRARYYSPNHGRFTQRDPARDGLNWYAYCGNNPIMCIDPLGTEYYIIYSKSEGTDFELEALSDKQNLMEKAGVPEDKIILIGIANGDEFVEAWNSMGIVKDSDGNVIGTCDIDNVIINTHANPMKLIVDNTNKSSAISSVSKSAEEKTLSNSLDNKSIKGNVIIYGCNAGHLNYQDSVGSVIASKTNGAPVLASDGTVSSTGNSLYVVKKGTKGKPDEDFFRYCRQAKNLSGSFQRLNNNEGEGWIVFRNNGYCVTRRIIERTVRKLYPCYAINISY